MHNVYVENDTYAMRRPNLRMLFVNSLFFFAECIFTKISL